MMSAFLSSLVLQYIAQYAFAEVTAIFCQFM